MLRIFYLTGLGLLIVLIAAIAFYFISAKFYHFNNDKMINDEKIDTQTEEEKTTDTLQLEEIDMRLKEKASEALAFCDSSGFNTDFCILIDMKIHSGKHRMFIYDFNEQKVKRKAGARSYFIPIRLLLLTRYIQNICRWAGVRGVLL